MLAHNAYKNITYKNIDLIKSIAEKVWGDNVEFGEMEIIDSPYSEFKWPLKLYSNVDVLLFYDRSALDIGINKNGNYVLMSEFTDQPFVRGMKATEPENLLNNFRVLDEVAKKICGTVP